ncbi:MAG: hypothetical protein AB7I19_04040 [Planctomycetota bacterium]
MNWDLIVAVVHALTAAALAGLCWFVQVVHYPLFAVVGADRFLAYEREHVRRTGWVVAPLMLAEAASAAWLFAREDAAGTRDRIDLGMLLLAVVWLSTFCLQVPMHRRLESGFDAAAQRRLVRTNWIRTIAWTVRAVLAVSILLALGRTHSW